MSEDASEFDFARVRRLAFRLPRAALRFRLHHGHACAVHFDIENRRGGGADGRQFQLFGRPDLLLRAGLNVGADSLRMALHRFRGDLNAGEKL